MSLPGRFLCSVAAAFVFGLVGTGNCRADLLLFYDFNDNSDAEAAIDTSGNGNHAEVFDAEYTDDGDGRSGNAGDRALDFLGDQDLVYIEVPSAEEGAFDSITENDSATISLWAFGGESQPQTNFAFWFADGDADPRQLGAHIPWSNGQVYFDVAGCCGPNQRITAPLGPDLYQDRWTHYAFVKDGESTAIYVDGELFLDSGANIIDPLDLITTVRFGSGQAPGQWSYNGLMDDIGVWDEALSEEAIEELAAGGGIGPQTPGDFNEDGMLDVTDVNLLSSEIAAKTNDPTFDLNEDQAVDGTDLNIWVKTLKKTWFGDADLNGIFNSGDFVRVFQAGKFELDVEAGWEEGDWNGDLRFGSGDFVVAFQDGGFEQGPLEAVNAVPEPSTLLLMVFGIMFLAKRKR